jgi:hypothetical protein
MPDIIHLLNAVATCATWPPAGLPTRRTCAGPATHPGGLGTTAATSWPLRTGISHAGFRCVKSPEGSERQAANNR